METWETLTSRRDTRSYTDDPLPTGALDQILEAGRRSPSSQNWQPWTFVAVTSRPALEELSKVWKGAEHVRSSAATIALVATPPADSRRLAHLHFDLGQATMAMLIEATDLGIGSAHAAVEDQSLARSVLHLAPDQECYYLVVLGCPDKPLRPIRHPDRRPFEDVVRRID